MLYFKDDKDILDYLMTSDFSEDLSPSECKKLLIKFRYFFRSNYSRNNAMCNEISKLNERIKQLEDNIENKKELLKESTTLYDKTVNRKLSLKEKITGKIEPLEYRRKFRIKDLFKK